VLFYFLFEVQKAEFNPAGRILTAAGDNSARCRMYPECINLNTFYAATEFHQNYAKIIPSNFLLNKMKTSVEIQTFQKLGDISILEFPVSGVWCPDSDMLGNYRFFLAAH